jgi:hypothetical protein
MKKISLFLLAFTLLFFSACNGDEPADYSTIKGSWRCVETSNLSGTRSYSIDIYRLKSDTTTYLISNFHNVSFDSEYDIKAKLSGNRLTIATQTIGSTQIKIESGTGTVDANRRQIVMDYTIFDGLSDSQVHVVYSR